jgi:hypothetical protein
MPRTSGRRLEVFPLLIEELARQREAVLLAEAAGRRLRAITTRERQDRIVPGWRGAAGRGLIALGTRLAGNGELPGTGTR